MIDLEIKKISVMHAKELSELLSNSSQEYNQHFIPFNFDEETISNILGNVVNDFFYGIYSSKKLIGFYMLRGFDKGYKIPSYGVFIKEEFAGKGLGRLTLDHAISQSRLLGCKRIMLKVHPENTNAKELYLRTGFKQEGYDPKNSNLIMFKDLK